MDVRRYERRALNEEAAEGNEANSRDERSMLKGDVFPQKGRVS